MKRNLLLLTAVVLVAVLLAGCTMWPFDKVKVTYKVDDSLKDLSEVVAGDVAEEEPVKFDVFKAHKNPAKVKKETVSFDVKFLFTDAFLGFVDGDVNTEEWFDVKVTGAEFGGEIELLLDAEENQIGIKFEVVDVQKEDVTVTIARPVS